MSINSIRKRKVPIDLWIEMDYGIDKVFYLRSTMWIEFKLNVKNLKKRSQYTQAVLFFHLLAFSLKNVQRVAKKHSLRNLRSRFEKVENRSVSLRRLTTVDLMYNASTFNLIPTRGANPEQRLQEIVHEVWSRRRQWEAPRGTRSRRETPSWARFKCYIRDSAVSWRTLPDTTRVRPAAVVVMPLKNEGEKTGFMRNWRSQSGSYGRVGRKT